MDHMAVSFIKQNENQFISADYLPYPQGLWCPEEGVKPFKFSMA
jgi:hypothetical protein